MTEKPKKNCKEQVQKLEALAAVHTHKINILTSRVALLEIGMKTLGDEIIELLKKKEAP